MKLPVNLLLTLIVCAAIGYSVEPYLFPHLTPSLDAISQKKSADGAPGEVDFYVPKKIAKPSVDVEPKDVEPPQKTDSAIAQQPPSPQTDKNRPADEPEKETIKKPPFPIQTIEINRYQDEALAGSPNLETAIRFAIDHQSFAELEMLLEKELYPSEKKSPEISAKQLERWVANPIWNHAINVYTFIRQFSYDELDRLTSATTLTPSFYKWILTHPEALTQFLQNITPHDDLHKALLVWQEIWEEEKDEILREKYLNLAIACALVFDRGNITPKTGYQPIHPLSRYQIFRKNAEAHRLKTILSKMEVADLVWVVDVPLSDLEIEWALRRANFSRRNWGKAYGHIDYLMERAVNGENPYDEYTLAQIEKHGGICGDQTYFSVNTAKANGIPATGVTGSGERGGHAWLAYKPNRDEWDTSTGRYENYSNGTSKNSQTNRKISEFDFFLMSDRKMKSARIKDADTLLRFIPILVAVKHDRQGIRQTLDEALDITPLYPDAWAALISFLEDKESNTTQEEWQKVIDTIERTFKNHPSMWMTARALTQKHIWKHLDSETIEKTQSRYLHEIARKFPDRSDLIREVIVEQMKTVNQKNDFKKTRSFYRQSFRLFGEDSLNFKFIAQQYFQTRQQFPDDREQICDDIESYFSRSIDMKSGDFFKAKSEIGILKTIANYYGQIGNQRKADKYKKEADRRLKKSTRRAL